jgi:S1-C subfamily serine protease
MMDKPAMSENPRGSGSKRDVAAAANSWLVIVLAGLAGVLLFKTVADAFRNRHDYSGRTVTARGDLASDEQATIEIFEKASPSVVYIQTKGLQQTFSGDIVEQQLGSGTGIVWDELGHIITNLHVVIDAVKRPTLQLQVQLADQRVFDARVIGAVSKHDIAVLQIEAEPSELIPVTIGTSGDLRVGQKVLAIGNPFGFDRTLSTGVIGGLDRQVPAEDGSVLAGMVQTDAAINPGNSGGPLLDSAGRLIAVNTAIVSTSGASAGLGFAVPVNDVLQAVDDVLKAATTTRRPSIGIGILDVATARANGIPDRYVVGRLVIRDVYPGTPAFAAGLRGTRRGRGTITLGDQILAINDRSLSTFEELDALLSELKPGDTISIDISRSGQRITVPLTLGERSDVILL